MGHLVSTIEFAKLLINHDHRLSVTLLIMDSPLDPTVNAYARSLASSPNSIPTRLHLTLLPNNFPSHQSHPNMASLFDAFFQYQIPLITDAISSLNSDPDSPRLVGFVADMFCVPVFDVAREFGLPAFAYLASGAAFLGFLVHLYALMDLHHVDTTAFNFKDSGMEFAFPGFVNRVPAKVFPHLAMEKEWDSFYRKHASVHKKVKGIIVNTIEELELHAVRSFSGGETSIPVYPVGPILNLKSFSSDPAQQGWDDVNKWLDDQPPSSVLFLCFGSSGYFDQASQVREIACALENSGVRFLWSLRDPPPSMKSLGSYNSNLREVLPEGFLARTAEIGRVIGWAPQAQVLAHQAIGGFVSHCGWNSILESIYFGVPIATWPFTAEQQINAFQLVHELKIGVEISVDYRTGFSNGSKTEVLSAERIEKGIKELMAKENEIRKKVKDLSVISRRALADGGSSYSYVGRFIDDIMNFVSS
ncbi:anthocyanidin 3-O-glucosyltransferase 2-like [Senna tora]|uniref:Glycosyltransferase n=1 Tax=Senna tora TaxID=362788 RepID=A0A834TXZ5_9FABA|nr:anthocyanidin 3-O-glucosyltransferase 2-like [Senna tora]